MKKLIAHLRSQQMLFVEELHRLCFQPESVQAFLDSADEPSGWLYLEGEVNSADWNLARLLGRPEVGAQLLDRLPAHELQLLLPPDVASYFPQWQPCGEIIWLVGPEIEELPPLKPLESRFKLHKLVHPKVSAFFNFSGLELFLLEQGRVVGLVKSIRETPDFTEVYIEVAPDRRQMGLGSFLLTAFMQQAIKVGKRLTYAVDAANAASCQLARRAGLVEFNRCLRLVKK